MGDSVTFGQGVKVEETFAKLIETSLNERLSARNIEIINFGVQGYTISNQVARYLTEVRQFKPDIAILTPISEDLNLNRELTFVDKNGFLTKARMGNERLNQYLRKLHTVYLMKEIYYTKIVIRSKIYQNNALTSESLAERLALLEREVKEVYISL